MISERLTGETSLNRDLEALSVSKRLVRSVSQKLKRKNYTGEEEKEDLVNTGNKRRVSASVQGEEYTKTSGQEETLVDCFSNPMKEKFWKKTNKKVLKLQEPQRISGIHLFLPDDVLEMCLMRLPLTSLMTARLVCKKWRNLTTKSRFMQTRREGFYSSPWLFLFGFVKDGYCSREIHALDVSLNQWHKIDAEVLEGRFRFSIASIQDDVYIVGGCSSLTNFGKMDRSSFKTHKGVLRFSPLTKSWHKVSSMKYVRSAPILGAYEIYSNSSIVKNHQNWQNRRFVKSRVVGVSDVFEDPSRLSVRHQFRSSLDENEVSFFSSMKPYRRKNDHYHSNTKHRKRFVLIAVGGLGKWDETLDSGEIYDSLSNKWMEIQKLPSDFGPVSSGVVCNGMFYIYSETDKLAGYDIERGFWVGIQTTPSPPRVHEYYPKLISCKRRLFMLSVSWREGDGEIGRRNKAVRILWELDLMNLNWTEVSIHPDAPMDWNAIFVADRNLIFGVEMFKIFGRVLDFLTMFDLSDTKMGWSHISKNCVARELDAASCMTKSMAMLHL